MKTLSKIYLIISLCFIEIILIYPNLIKGNIQNKNTENNYPVCSVESSIESKKGKKIFRILCASCHKLDKKLIGPALSGIDSIVFFNWLTLKDKKLDTTKFDKNGIDYHKNTFGKKLNENQIKELYEYLNFK